MVGLRRAGVFNLEGEDGIVILGAAGPLVRGVGVWGLDIGKGSFDAGGSLDDVSSSIFLRFLSPSVLDFSGVN